MGSKIAYWGTQEKVYRCFSIIFVKLWQEWAWIFNHVVTDDETWICYYTPEKQAKEWHHSNSLKKKLRKFNQTPSRQKMMAFSGTGKVCSWWSSYLVQWQCNVYCETLTTLRRAIQNRHHGLPVHLNHDNARPHCSMTLILLEKFEVKTLGHPPYSPDLAPFRLPHFSKLKGILRRKTDGKWWWSEEKCHWLVKWTCARLLWKRDQQIYATYQ